VPTHYDGTPEEVRALNTWIKLTRAADSFGARLADHGTCSDVTVSQFGVIEALYHLGPMCQSELAGKILKSSGNMTLVLDNLEQRGLVERQRDSADRRFVTVRLSEAGQALIAGVFPGHVAGVVRAIGVLSAEEQEQLGTLCRKLGLGAATQEVGLSLDSLVTEHAAE